MLTALATALSTDFESTQGDHPAQAQASARGVPGVPQADREVRSRGSGRAPDRGQHLHPQASPGQGLAGAAALLPCALHTHLCLLAEPGGAVVWTDHPEGDSAGELLQRLAAGFCVGKPSRRAAVGADRQDRAVRSRLRPDQGVVQLDDHS